MNQGLLGLAFGAGLVAALNPCGFALLPAYLTLVVRADRAGVLTAVGRALAATVAMTLGFLAAFGAFGLLTVTVAAAVERFLQYVTIVIGISLVALGIWLLLGRDLTALTPRALVAGRRAPTARLGSMFGYGVGYAIASLSCTIGPFLAVTGATFRGGPLLDGLMIYLAYAAGFGLLVGV
ncbi:MAG: cytochrome c biogenesis protein CcdA, partial [Mycobacterium sp.]